MSTFYVYNDRGENIACVVAESINDAYSYAQYVTGVNRNLLSVERS